MIILPHWLAQMAPGLIGLPFAAAVYGLAWYTRENARKERARAIERQLPAE